MKAGLPFILALVFYSVNVSAQTDSLPDTSSNFIPPSRPFHFITNVPADIYQVGKTFFSRENRRGSLIALAATAVLIPLDQAVSDGVKRFSRNIHLDPNTHYKVPVKIGSTKILKIPQNLTSALYQLGEGGTSMLIAAGLFTYGKCWHRKYAVEVASDLAESFITLGLTTQVLKRISGRESPFKATQKGGAWRPFPSFRAYQAHTPEYDAFPSGHLATMMGTVTTLVMSYPEKKWIKPVGYGIMTLSSLTMINTDVHWISDYPLALALGYISAKVIHRKNHRAPQSITKNLHAGGQSIY